MVFIMSMENNRSGLPLTSYSDYWQPTLSHPNNEKFILLTFPWLYKTHKFMPTEMLRNLSMLLSVLKFTITFIFDCCNTLTTLLGTFGTLQISIQLIMWPQHNARKIMQINVTVIQVEPSVLFCCCSFFFDAFCSTQL